MLTYRVRLVRPSFPLDNYKLVRRAASDGNLFLLQISENKSLKYCAKVKTLILQTRASLQTNIIQFIFLKLISPIRPSLTSDDLMLA